MQGRNGLSGPHGPIGSNGPIGPIVSECRIAKKCTQSAHCVRVPIVTQSVRVPFGPNGPIESRSLGPRWQPARGTATSACASSVACGAASTASGPRGPMRRNGPRSCRLRWPASEIHGSASCASSRSSCFGRGAVEVHSHMGPYRDSSKKQKDAVKPMFGVDARIVIVFAFGLTKKNNIHIIFIMFY